MLYLKNESVVLYLCVAMLHASAQLSNCTWIGENDENWKAVNDEASLRMFETTEEFKGGVALMQEKLMICRSPKAGSTTTEWMMQGLLGHNEPHKICHGPHERPPYLIDNNEDYRGALLIKYLNETVRSQIFRSNEWVTIAVVRDPWSRAISSFKDQIHRGHFSGSEDSRDDFMRFVQTHPMSYNHFGYQSSNCGLSYLRYDYYIDIECLSKLDAVLRRHRPQLTPRLESGWESCTLDNSPSLLFAVSGSSTGHQNNLKNESILSKVARYDEQFCDFMTAAVVAMRFDSDYKALCALGGACFPQPHTCSSS